MNTITTLHRTGTSILYSTWIDNGTNECKCDSQTNVNSGLYANRCSSVGLPSSSNQFVDERRYPKWAEQIHLFSLIVNSLAVQAGLFREIFVYV